jgi:hypothetical protein
MRTITIDVLQFTTKLVTKDGEVLNLIIKLGGVQCPKCFNLLGSIPNKSDRKLVDVELCNCWNKRK